MVTQTLIKFRPSGIARAHTHHVCRACGGQFTTHAGDHLTAVFCATCLEARDEPVTAEHAWDLGGGD